MTYIFSTVNRQVLSSTKETTREPSWAGVSARLDRKSVCSVWPGYSEIVRHIAPSRR